jgi:hypothetical protein
VDSPSTFVFGEGVRECYNCIACWLWLCRHMCQVLYLDIVQISADQESEKQK